MKSCLVVVVLLLTLSACGDAGPDHSQGTATGEEAQKLAHRHLELGIELHEHRRFSDAVLEYDLSLRLYPHYAEAYLNRGMAYAQLDDAQRAIQDFEQAVRLDPNLPRAYVEWGRALMAMDRPQDAIRYFDEAILLDPLDTASYLDRGDSYSDLGVSDRTLSDYNEAVQIEPEKAEVYYQRGLERTGLEEFKLALEKLR